MALLWWTKCICTGIMRIIRRDDCYRCYASMSTPSFSTNFTYCLTFDYHRKYGINHELYIHIRSKNYPFSGQETWRDKRYGPGQETLNIPVWNDPLHGEARLDFIGLGTGMEISNVKFIKANCENITEMDCLVNDFQCRNRQQCVPLEAMCNGTSECVDSSDEETTACGEYPTRLCELLWLINVTCS